MLSKFKGKIAGFGWEPIKGVLLAIGIWFLITLAIAFGLVAIDFAITSWFSGQGNLIWDAISLIVASSVAALSVYGTRKKWDKVTWISTIAFVLLVGILLSARYWDELRGSEESLSATIRNIGLLIGGVIAAILAMWRSVVSERQADIAEKGMLGERYQKGAEMLGSDVLSVRLGGIYAIDRIAKEHPEEYHIQALELLCAFARHPTKNEQVEVNIKEGGEGRRLREDVESAMRAIASRSGSAVAIEDQEDFALYLRDAELSNLHLRVQNANLVNAWLVGAKLPYAWLESANLSNAILRNSDLSHARLWDANLSGTDLDDADLTGAELYKANASVVNLSAADSKRISVRGLTQSQLDQACADPDNPPKLVGGGMRRPASLWCGAAKRAARMLGELRGVASVGDGQSLFSRPPSSSSAMSSGSRMSFWRSKSETLE